MSAKTKDATPVARKSSGKWNIQTVLPWLFLITGAVATAASTMLSVEVFNRLKNPAFVPVCNLNPILSCTSVADSSQAHLFGFPNYFIGVAGYAAIMAFGLAILSGAVFARWLWRLVLLGLTFAVGFVTWLQFETLYRIGALCIFCMVVWACTIPLFWYTLLYNYDSGYLGVPARFKRPAAFIRRHHGDIILLWFLIIIALILKRFWYYWSTL